MLSIGSMIMVQHWYSPRCPESHTCPVCRVSRSSRRSLSTSRRSPCYLTTAISHATSFPLWGANYGNTLVFLTFLHDGWHYVAFRYHSGSPSPPAPLLVLISTASAPRPLQRSTAMRAVFRSWSYLALRIRFPPPAMIIIMQEKCKTVAVHQLVNIYHTS